MLTRLYCSGYRSIRDLQIGLTQLDVIVGPNGSGKTNLYRALWLLGQSATGRLARALADEGGLLSALSSTEPPCTSIRLGCREADWDYELEIGMPPHDPDAADTTAFRLDPNVRTETLTLRPRGARPVVFLDRSYSRVSLRDAQGRMTDFPHALDLSETALSQLRDPARYPELALLRARLAEWRFYHQFRTDDGSPIRRGQVGVFTPVLAHDGSDLAAALQTVREHTAGPDFEQRLRAAFPEARVLVDVDPHRALFEVTMLVPSMRRPLRACELSDGTLRFLCLLTALSSPRPPELMVLNEPETSIHPALLPLLADLIVDTGQRSQVLLTSHSRELATAIVQRTGREMIELDCSAGHTTIVGRGRYE